MLVSVLTCFLPLLLPTAFVSSVPNASTPAFPAEATDHNNVPRVFLAFFLVAQIPDRADQWHKIVRG